MTPTVPHKHAALIKQWADNPNIILQWLNAGEGKWRDMPLTPNWNASEVRIKPEPKPDVIRERQIYVHGDQCALSFLRHEQPNVRFTFDGETNKLKSVEML